MPKDFKLNETPGQVMDGNPGSINKKNLQMRIKLVTALIEKIEAYEIERMAIDQRVVVVDEGFQSLFIEQKSECISTLCKEIADAHSPDADSDAWMIRQRFRNELVSLINLNKDILTCVEDKYEDKLKKPFNGQVSEYEQKLADICKKKSDLETIQTNLKSSSEDIDFTQKDQQIKLIMEEIKLKQTWIHKLKDKLFTNEAHIGADFYERCSSTIQKMKSRQQEFLIKFKGYYIELAAYRLVHDKDWLPFQGPVKEATFLSAAGSLVYNVAIPFGKHGFFKPTLTEKLSEDEETLLRTGLSYEEGWLLNAKLTNEELQLLKKSKSQLQGDEVKQYETVRVKQENIKKARAKDKQLKEIRDKKADNKLREDSAVRLLRSTSEETVKRYDSVCKIS